MANPINRAVAHTATIALHEQNLWKITFTYRCICGQEHEAVEVDGMPVMDSVAFSNKCGDVEVFMPWYGSGYHRYKKSVSHA